MEIRKKELCGFTIFEIRGEINDQPILDKVRKIIDRTVKNGREDMAIDLRNCDYLNSGLIGNFIGWKNELTEKKKMFCLIEPSEKALETLTLTGIPQLVTVYKNEVEFMQKVKPEA
jgi:anti-anti-sigma factor